MNSHSKSSNWIYKLDKAPELKHLSLMEPPEREPKCPCKRPNVELASFEFDIYGFITNWSVKAEHVFGYEPEEIIGKHIASLYTVADLIHGKPLHELKVVDVRKAYFNVGWQKRKSGQEFWAYSETQALRDASRKIVGYRKFVAETASCLANTKLQVTF